jgi:hypothetical protein
VRAVATVSAVQMAQSAPPASSVPSNLVSPAASSRLVVVASPAMATVVTAHARPVLGSPGGPQPPRQPRQSRQSRPPNSNSDSDSDDAVETILLLKRKPLDPHASRKKQNAQQPK